MTKVHARLLATAGPHEGQAFSVGERTVIGRGDDVDIQLLGDEVSRHHCALRLDDAGKVWLRDLSSATGTRIGGTPVTGTVELAEGTVFEVGGSSFELQFSDQVTITEKPASDLRVRSRRTSVPTTFGGDD